VEFTRSVADSNNSQQLATITSMKELVETENTEEKPFETQIVKQRRNYTRRFTPKTDHYKEVESWANYVNGQGNLPRKPYYKAKTLISTSRSECAANKPIISCKIEGEIINTLFDTGAESNIADFTLVEKFRRINPKIKVIKREGRLNCANGSPIKIVGFTFLYVRIGNKIIGMKFTVVDKIFPKLIVGIKYMKRFDIKVIPASDSIMIGEEKIGFLSKIEEVEEN
jgi:hypothetical protein